MQGIAGKTGVPVLQKQIVSFFSKGQNGVGKGVKVLQQQTHLKKTGVFVLCACFEKEIQGVLIRE